MSLPKPPRSTAWAAGRYHPRVSTTDAGSRPPGRRLRRPSGEAPPLPRASGWTRWLPVAVAVVALGVLLALMMEDDPLAIDLQILRSAADLRTAFLVDVAKVFDVIASAPAIFIMRIATVVVLASVKRWRHFVVLLLTWGVSDLVFLWLHVGLPVPPVPVLAEPVSSSGAPAYYFPGVAMMALSITVFGMCYALAPAGSARRGARWGGVALLAAVGLSRILLAAVYPSAAAYAIALAATVAFVTLTWFAPDEAFPVSYAKGGNAAHLDLGGARSDAVKRAMSDQVGVAITEVTAFGNEGSGGSTPLLMTADDGTRIFGKILATSHVRADRWYRIGRTIMYGKLEDEAPFGSVRRLIGYEDYALRLLDDDGFHIAKTYGVVELTPNREYLLPTEFFEGSETLGHADVSDTIIDEGLALIRRLWDEGLAHRDIKPANLLVFDGHLQLIDVSGLEVRPSPWRQAVDLANMMLVMALKSDADRVYAIALRYFTPEDVGEAFACAVGMAIPTELQRYLKEDGRDLVGRFKELAPHHAPVSIQRWSASRIALTVAAAFGAVVVVLAGWAALVAGLP